MHYSPSSLSKEDHLHYQNIIDKLTHENQNLRMHIDNCIECQQHSSHLLKLSTRSEQSHAERGQDKTISVQTVPLSNKKVPHCTCFGSKDREQLIQNNAKLKAQLQQRTRSYESKIEELNVISQKLKQQKQVHIQNSNQSRQKTKRMFEEVEKVINMFEFDRVTLTSKIEQLLQHIQMMEDRQSKSKQKIRELQLDLQIVQQQLKLLKKSRKTYK